MSKEHEQVAKILAGLARKGKSPNLRKQGEQAAALVYKDSLSSKERSSIEHKAGDLIHTQREAGFHSGTPSNAQSRGVPSVKSLRIKQIKKRLLKTGKWNTAKIKPVKLKPDKPRPFSEKVWGKNPAFKHYFENKSDVKNYIHKDWSGKISTRS